jgi:nucleoside 2-deoxyribosyltransferase
VSRPRRVYLAAPFSSDPAGNTARVVAVALDLRDAGFHPFVPHVACDWATARGGYEAAMRECMAWLDVCDALVRLPGHSPGADREVARARELGIPVFYAVADVITWGAR